jgi:hypothetical protein
MAVVFMLASEYATAWQSFRAFTGGAGNPKKGSGAGLAKSQSTGRAGLETLMGSKKDQRRKTRDTKGKTKAKTRQARGSAARKANSRAQNARVHEASGWPLHECWASPDWHERGVTVQAVLVRRHPSGRYAAAFFEVDLQDQGVLSSRVVVGLEEPNLNFELGKASSEDDPLVVVEAALVRKLVETGAEWGQSRDHGPKGDYRKACQLFGDVNVDDWPHDILVGGEEEDLEEADTEEPGFFFKLKRRIGL